MLQMFYVKLSSNLHVNKLVIDILIEEHRLHSCLNKSMHREKHIPLLVIGSCTQPFTFQDFHQFTNAFCSLKFIKLTNFNLLVHLCKIKLLNHIKIKSRAENKNRYTIVKAICKLHNFASTNL